MAVVLLNGLRLVRPVIISVRQLHPGTMPGTGAADTNLTWSYSTLMRSGWESLSVCLSVPYINSRGPSIDPCGAPLLTFWRLNWKQSSTQGGPISWMSDCLSGSGLCDQSLHGFLLLGGSDWWENREVGVGQPDAIHHEPEVSCCFPVWYFKLLFKLTVTASLWKTVQGYACLFPQVVLRRWNVRGNVAGAGVSCFFWWVSSFLGYCFGNIYNIGKIEKKEKKH